MASASACIAGGGYAIFAGKEVSRALGIMSLEEKDCSDNLTDLNEKQMATLQEWEDKFKTKYEIVGKVWLQFSVQKSSIWSTLTC